MTALDRLRALKPVGLIASNMTLDGYVVGRSDFALLLALAEGFRDYELFFEENITRAMLGYGEASDALLALTESKP